MDARDKLFGALRQWMPARDADELIDTFAHGLAEEVRKFAEQENGHLLVTSASVYVHGIRDAADLIDPEVSA